MSAELKAYPYDAFNKQFAKTFYEYMLDYERFAENYKLLLDGLSEEQQRFLTWTFARIIYMHHGNFYTDNDFTHDELQKQADLKENFYNKITLSYNYYNYNDYLLPAGPATRLEASVFYYEMGLGKLNNKEKLNGLDFIDAGAFVGDSALILNKLAPRKIYAFEPVSECFNLLLDTIDINNVQNKIVPINMGLGSIAKEDKIHACGGVSGAFFLQYDPNCAKENIIVDTIDNFVEANNLEVGLIKIDVEGKEMEVLRGAERTIKKFKPAIHAGIYHNAEEFFEFKPLLESWNLGYKFYFDKLNPGNFLNEINILCEVY